MDSTSMPYFTRISSRSHWFMDLRDMISRVEFSICLLRLYWLERYSVLWDMPFGLGMSFFLVDVYRGADR
jgi:hypothetical protein